MRISEHNRYMMKKSILADLYGSHFSKLDEEKEAFLKKNLALEFAPYTEYIAKIPDHLLNVGYRYSVRVTYKKNDPTDSYKDDWGISFTPDEAVPRQISGKYYTVHPSLYAEVASIIEKEQVIKKEKKEMENFIDNTFSITTGSKQIRRMWPESLHKYLPTEPVLVKRQRDSKGKIVLPTVTAPSQLQTRLVNNLLEK